MVETYKHDIADSLIKDMKKQNFIRCRDLWNFLKKHKEKSKNEFGGWILSQEFDRTDKLIMAIDLWNATLQQKLSGTLEKVI